MLKSSPLTRIAAIAFAFALVTMAASMAQAQFTLSLSPFNPNSVVPGNQALSSISVSANGFNGVVSLSCSITPVQTINPPTCTTSPDSVVPPASPSLTVATSNGTPSGSYTVTVTGTGQGAPTQTATLTLTVLPVTPAYTLTVTTTVSPTTVHAGSGATATITITPINGYTGNVTVSCSAITPTVTETPTCSFNPTPVVVNGPTTQTSTLTITTIGPTTAWRRSRVYYALLGMPLLGFCVFRVLGRKMQLRYVSLMAVVMLLGWVVLLPACGNSYNNSTPSNPSGVTPKNTYSFTLNATDDNAVAPSNGTQTVSLTVN